MPIINSTLTNIPAQSIYTSSGNSAVTTIYFCNKTGLSVTVNVYVVANASVSGGNNIIYSNLVLAGNDTYVVDSERLLLDDGSFIAANASANSAVITTVSYTGI